MKLIHVPMAYSNHTVQLPPVPILGATFGGHCNVSILCMDIEVFKIVFESVKYTFNSILEDCYLKTLEEMKSINYYKSTRNKVETFQSAVFTISKVSNKSFFCVERSILEKSTTGKISFAPLASCGWNGNSTIQFRYSGF